MSTFEDINPEDLVSIYQRAHEELSELETHTPSASDHTERAFEARSAIERHRVMIRELRRALQARN